MRPNVNKPCKVCGTIVSVNNNGRPALCSNECRRINRNRTQLNYNNRHRGEPIARDCTICGKPTGIVTRRTDRAVLCSDACRAENQRRYNANIQAMRTARTIQPCIECGKDATAPNYRGVPLCSAECRETRKAKMAHRQYIEKPCAVCGEITKGFNNGRSIFCSDECRRIAKIDTATAHKERTLTPKTERRCCVCNAPTLTRKTSKNVTCSGECSKQRKRQAQQDAYFKRHPTEMIPCDVCATPVESRRFNRWGEPIKRAVLCSAECRLIHNNAQAKAWQRAKALEKHGPIPPCKMCGTTKKRRSSDYCKECKPNAPPKPRKPKSPPKPRKPKAPPLPKPPRYCKMCNAQIPDDRHGCAVTCSPECSRKNAAEITKRRNATPENKAKRKAAKKNLKSRTNTALRQLWWEKQDGKCYLCGLDIPESALHIRGAYHLEHGDPVSRGGKEVTGLACAECNIAKGARTVEEYRASDKSEPANNPLTRFPDWGPFDWKSIR